MKLTSKGTYALIGVLDMINNGDGNAVRLQEISERQGIARTYLEQLFHRMRKQGLVRSVRGPGGGYVMARPATEITVKDVLASVGEKISFEYSESATQEGGAFASFFSGLSTTIQEQLNRKLSDLTATSKAA